MTVSVMISKNDLANLRAGRTYRSGSDGTQRVKDALALIGITEPTVWVCAFVYHGSFDPVSVPYGLIEARLRIDRILDRIFVLADEDVKQLCSRALKEKKGAAQMRGLKGLVSVSSASAQDQLLQIHPRRTSGYCELRIRGPISFEDVEGFYCLNGKAIAVDEDS